MQGVRCCRAALGKILALCFCVCVGVCARVRANVGGALRGIPPSKNKQRWTERSDVTANICMRVCVSRHPTHHSVFNPPLHRSRLPPPTGNIRDGEKHPECLFGWRQNTSNDLSEGKKH